MAGDNQHLVLGVDIGGSGMKAAIVDVTAGEMIADRIRIDTPRPATPPAMHDAFAWLVEELQWSGPIGCTFPGVIRRHAVVETAANLDPSWVGVDAAALFSTNGTPVMMINDADAAGLAEVHGGAGQGVEGVIFMLTIGTGFGTAIFNDGVLLPNIELGHIEIDGVDAEELATSRAREEQKLSLEVWAKRLERYLNRIEDLVWPDMFIIGGGVSKSFDEFAPLITTRATMIPARLENNAGIVGAALAASGGH